MNNYEYKKLCPFKLFVLENFPFIEADFDALTNWQLFCKLGNEINKIIASTNSLGTQVVSLTDYVSNYFDNLDVQKEINNKLDEMAQDGTLAEIIAQYVNVQSVLAFDSVTELKNANNLINGTISKTLGYNNYKDGKGHFYKIREYTTSDNIDEINIIKLNNYDNLIAELIPYETSANYMLGCYFSDNSFEPHFFVSDDGLNLNKIDVPFEKFPFDIKDMDIKYHEGLFYLASTYMTENADVYIGTSSDLIHWVHHYINLGLYDESNKNRWAPALLFTELGELYLSISKQYDTLLNPSTNTEDPAFDIYLAKCNNLSNLTFDTAKRLVLNGEGKSANRNHIDADIIQSKSLNKYVMIVKNEDTKFQEIFTSENLTDWTLIKTLDILPKWTEGAFIQELNGTFIITAENYWSDTTNKIGKMIMTQTTDFNNFTHPKILNIDNEYAIKGKLRHGNSTLIDDDFSKYAISKFKPYFFSNYEILNGITLFEGDSITSIKLSDNIEKYSKAYIELYNVDADDIVSFTLENPNNKKLNPTHIILNEDGSYFSSCVIKFINDSLTIDTNYQSVNRSNEYNRYAENPFHIKKIVGYY